MVADTMQVVTSAGGKETTLTIIKDELAKAKYDLEKVNLPINVSDCKNDIHGTKIILRGLNQNYNFPNPEKLKQLLILDYGRTSGFSIFVNNEKITIQDFSGKTYIKELLLQNGKKAKLIYTIADKTIKQSGIVYRVGNKIVGRPENFLKDDEIVPSKLQKRVVGEVICDDLEDFVTADHGAIIENSILNEEIRQEVKQDLSASLNSVFTTDMKLAKARYQQRINRELEKLPEFKKKFAEKALQRVLEKFYYEAEDKVNSIISVMIDALEKDYYWNVVQSIEQARDGDIESFADALNEFGFVEMSAITNQATNRLRFLDELDLLLLNQNTLEATIHKALENNLWVLGNEYSIIFSNKTLKIAIKDYCDKKFSGARANKRPDLFLGQDINRNYLLIEFKKPSETIGRDTESQAQKYRDDLNTLIHNKKINIILLGGKVSSIISSHNEREDIKYITYKDIVSNARTQLDWLLDELKRN